MQRRQLNDLKDSHNFDPTKKITKVECIIQRYEHLILQINLYSGKERLIQVVGYSDGIVERWGGRVETFEIADDEQLIGCKLDHCKAYLRGVT